MSAPIPLRRDFGASQLRGLAKKTKDGPQARRLLALAAIYDGATGLAAGRRLPRNQAQPAARSRPCSKVSALSDGCNQSRRNRHADTRNRYQPPSIFVLFRPAYELRIKFPDSPIKVLPLGANVCNQHAHPRA